ncbi:MAG: signal recognition particle-docking protein FtsY [Candidatus Micrarchaeia archaeon]
MFNLLKNKLSNFVETIAKKVSGKKEETEERTKQLEGAVPTESDLKAETKETAPGYQPQHELERTVESVERQLKVKPTLLTKIKGLVLPEIMIKEADVKEVIDDLELQLLEADVALPVAEFIKEDLKAKLVGKNVRYSELSSFVKHIISQILLDLLRQEKFDIISFINQRKKPVKILFLGPNGHGKTTTIAKFAHLLKKNGMTCVISASDTFRAAAIEQTSEHATRLGVSAIKHQYGADPAAVAFDAIRHAEANNIDVVLIDTAGRQETDRNLIEQLKKISRVVNPDLKLFVVEGIVGNAVMEQISQFNAAIPLDGVILTKIDCDAKGGAVISIRKATGVPVLYLGIGQGYDDLVPFSSDFIISRLMA